MRLASESTPWLGACARMVAAFALAGAPASASNIARQQISNDSSEDGRPRIAAGQVVWESGAAGDTEIDLFDGDSTGSITVNAEDIEPEISDTYVIWKRVLAGGTNCRLDVFDFDTTETLNSSMPCDRDALVAGPHVIWTDPAGVVGDDVFVSTGGADPERLGRSSVDESFARVGDVGGSPRAVWIEGDQDIVFWNGSDADVIADSPPSDSLRSQLRMNGGRAVWTDVVGGDTEIFLYTGTTVAQLTNNTYDDEDPQVRGSHVVWTGFPDGPSEGEIFHYDGTTTERVTDDDLPDFDPRVSLGADGTTIAWVKDEGANEVWMFDGCESSRVSIDDATDDDSVELDENQVAWVRGSGSGSEIWTAAVTCDVACGNAETEPGEECDDGNTVDGDGCSATCLEEVCGNDRVDFGEECDDGNTATLDGCDAACLFECGNSVVAGDEQCDLGDRIPGDGCDENCIEEVCGNGVLQGAAGEVCDDGNTLSGDGCSADCGTVESPAPVAQQRCIQKLNERGAALVKAQHKQSLACLTAAAKGDTAALGVPATAQDCLTNDPKGKIAKAQTKTLDGEASQCEPADLPTFAYAGGAAVNTAGTAESVALMADLFGANLDLAVIAKALDAPGAKCQKSVTQATQALANRLFKLSVKEKKLLLAGKEDGSLARSNDALETQLLVFLEADAAGKIAQKEADLRSAARTKCGSVALDAAFPGCAPSADATALATCATNDARCRFCRSFNAFDGLAIDCDAFDDDAANASCP
jgi:cysteine-rich repeat protein